MEDVLSFVGASEFWVVKVGEYYAQDSLCYEVTFEKFAFQNDEWKIGEKHKEEGDIIEGRNKKGQDDRGEVK